MPARRPNGSPKHPPHAFRVPNELWLPAKQRAHAEGVTMSAVLYRFVEAYGQGGNIVLDGEVVRV